MATAIPLMATLCLGNCQKVAFHQQESSLLKFRKDTNTNTSTNININTNTNTNTSDKADTNTIHNTNTNPYPLGVNCQNVVFHQKGSSLLVIKCYK